MISILHPSRSRAGIAYRTATTWIANAGCKVEHILSLDSSDDDLLKYPDLDIKIVGDNRSAVDAINRAAAVAHGDILIVVSDDTLCFPGWGKRIEEVTSRWADWVLKTDDGIQPWIITMPIMDRLYYEKVGHIYHPSYKHGWCDTEFTCVAELHSSKRTVPLTFKHNHHDITGIKDAVSERCDASFEEGRANFIARKKNNFDIINPIGKMTPNFYTLL
jgi:hypothetical protein